MLEDFARQSRHLRIDIQGVFFVTGTPAPRRAKYNIQRYKITKQAKKEEEESVVGGSGGEVIGGNSSRSR